jgi:S1-C subfamily serine protease
MISKRWNVPGGVLIQSVGPNSGAATAGLRGRHTDEDGDEMFGDLIIALDDKPVKNNDDLLSGLEKHKPGDRVKVAYLRDAKKRTTDIVLQEPPK